MDVKINKYAPVLIPTLNRYNHLKNCLESLENCTGASETDVFVALDYPPTEKYVEGWKKIDEYLKEKELLNNFKKLVVIRRDYNLGLGHPAGNSITLRNEVLKSYDRFIASEDDNVFSKNFLEFINKGLEIYKNDKRVLAICGYKNDFECMHGDNNHFAQHSLFQAWGYGMWSNRFQSARESLTPSYFRRILYRHKKWRRCFKYWPHWFYVIIGNAMSTKIYLPCHDINMDFYLINENKCVICPTISKVRNTGWDSSATTTTLDKGNLRGRAEHELNLVIDKEETFEYKGDPLLYEDENSYAIARWDGQWETGISKSLIRAYLNILRFRIFALLGVV